MTVRGLCDEAGMCGPLNVTPFFPCASDWEGKRIHKKEQCTKRLILLQRAEGTKRTNKSSCLLSVDKSQCVPDSTSCKHFNILRAHTGTALLGPVNSGCNQSKGAVKSITALAIIKRSKSKGRCPSFKQMSKKSNFASNMERRECREG